MKLNLHLNYRRPLQFVLIICCCLMIFIFSSFALPPLNTSKPLEVLALNQETEPVFYLTSQLFVLIICCCLMIFIFSSFALPPLNTSKPLEVLALNQETEPVFYLTSQLTYNHAWFTEPSLSLASNDILPTNETDDRLNLLLTLSETELNYSQIAEDLSKLSQYFSEISLSVLPSNSMTDQTYLKQYELLYSALHEKQLSSISMIAYPPTTTKLSLYNRTSVAYVGTVLRKQYELLYSALHEKQLSSISMIAYPPTTTKLSLYNRTSVAYVGTVLRSQDDLDTLHQIYQYFYNKKPLVIRDDIKTFYANDAQLAAREITASYYMLAVNYPAIEMIFSPYVAPPVSYEDSYVLSSSDVNFMMLNLLREKLQQVIIC